MTLTVAGSRTVVVVRATGSPAVPGSGRPSDIQARASTATGSAIAVSFSQNWKAWTIVIDRIPPATTLSSTMTATSRAPTQVGAPVTVRRASPAPWNCGSRYSQPIPTTSSEAIRRTRWDCRRSSAKSGRV